MSLDQPRLQQFALDLAADPDRWRHLVRHETDVRVYEQIWSDRQVNAWIICWSTDQDTGFHDHDDAAGCIVVVSGQVREERLALGSRPVVSHLGAGEHLAVPAHAIHRVLHTGFEPAVTIHAYSPPLTRTGAYRISNGVLERQSLPSGVALRALAMP